MFYHFYIILCYTDGGFHCSFSINRSNILNAQVYALSFAFASSIIFFIYAGCFRFGAYLVSTGEMDAEKVFR